MTVDHSDGREQAFSGECEALEEEIDKRAHEFWLNKVVHRWVKLLVGWLAVVAGAVATATAFNDQPEVAAWAALATTVLVGWKSWQNPAEKEADHQGREAACRDLERQVRHLRTLRTESVSYNERVDELARRSNELKEICARPWIK